jgi:hypothetical protein
VNQRKPLGDPEQVVAPGPVLASWLGESEGAPGSISPQGPHGALVPQGTAGAQGPQGEPARSGGVIRLFSMNDYLGLSTHPAVCRAISEAAAVMGSGRFLALGLLARVVAPALGFLAVRLHA